jgi:hypothetical protein
MVAALSLTLLLVTGAAKQEPPRFGKTNAEILKMGRDGWTKFAAEDRMGGSTAAYVSSEETYGEALKARNDSLLKKKPVYRKAFAGLRQSLFEYSNEFVSIGSGITGGGTMWNTVSASIAPDVEEILYTAFAPPKPKGKAVTPAQIDQAIARATQTVQRKRKQIDANKEFSHMSYADCMASLTKARKLKASALALAAPLPKSTQNAIRRYLVDATDLGMAE